MILSGAELAIIDDEIPFPSQGPALLATQGSEDTINEPSATTPVLRARAAAEVPAHADRCDASPSVHDPAALSRRGRAGHGRVPRPLPAGGAPKPAAHARLRQRPRRRKADRLTHRGVPVHLDQTRAIAHDAHEPASPGTADRRAVPASAGSAGQPRAVDARATAPTNAGCPTGQSRSPGSTSVRWGNRARDPGCSNDCSEVARSN